MVAASTPDDTLRFLGCAHLDYFPPRTIELPYNVAMLLDSLKTRKYLLVKERIRLTKLTLILKLKPTPQIQRRPNPDRLVKLHTGNLNCLW
jgi:hypothetical protein